MKLSEMTTDQAMDFYCAAAPEIEAITKSESWPEVAEVLKDFSASTLFTKLLPLLLKNNRASVYRILGALNGKTAQQVEKQPATQTMTEARDLFDEEFINFFSRWVSGEQPQ